MLARQRDGQRIARRFQSLRALRAQQDDGPRRMLQQEGQRHITALRIIEGRQTVQRVVQFGQAAGVIRLRRVSLAQPAPGQRRPDNRRCPGFLAPVQRAIFQRLQVQRGEFRLGADNMRAEMRLQRAGLRHGEVGNAGKADLSVCDQGVQRAGNFFPRGQQVRAVDLVQINLLNPQPRQRGFAGLNQIGPAGIVGHRRNDPALAGQHHPGAPRRICRKHLAQQCLCRAEPGSAKTVNVGRINQCHAQVERGLDQRLGMRQVMSQKTPAPKAQAAGFKSARSDLRLPHAFTP